MTSRTRSFVVSILFLVVLLCAGAALAQSSARIEGNVRDNTGAALPGVTVTATNIATNVSRTTVSEANGAYTITPLAPGDYSVKAELSGFQTVVTPITLVVNQVARMDFKLPLGNVSESLTVVATAPTIEKTTSYIGTVIDQQQVQNLPLNGRNFTQLATLVPGVNRGIPGSNSSGGGSGTDAETFRYSEFGGAALSVNGLREQFNNYTIDGLDNNESLVNNIAYLPPPEAIREFGVITTNAPAEFGRAGGAIQTLVIKSGTNDLSGSLYYFLRPKSLAAKPQFAQEKPDFKNEDFGLTAGGPIFRDRTFFFGSYHGLRNSIPIEAGNYVTVPTAKMRNGDFSELLDAANNGLGQAVQIYNPITGEPLPNNQVPASLIDPAGQAYLKAFPNPTRAGVVRNYLTQRQKRSTYNDYDARFDHTLFANNQMFLSGSHWADQFSDPGRIPGYQAGFGAGTSNNEGYAVRFGDSHVFNSNLVNELHVGHVDFRFEFLPVGFGQNQNDALGIGGPGGVNVNNGISLVGGGNGFYIEYLGDFGQYRIFQKTTQLSDAVTWLSGNHSFKFGGTAMRRDVDQERTNVGKGFYFYRDAFGFTPGRTGYEVSDMLAAVTDFTSTGIPGFVPRNTRSWENAVFAQDDWRVNPNLTLNLGLRYDLLTPYYETDNKLANYDPVTQQLILPDQNGATKSTLKTDKNNFGPRLGINYLINDRTTVRAAYGRFFSLDRGGIDRELTENPPAVVTQYRFGSDPGANVRLSDPIPLPDPVDPSSPVLPQGSGVVYIPANSKTTQVDQYSISAQREVLKNTSLMVAYVGTHAENLAALITSAGFAGAIADRLSTTMYIGESRYNALQMALRQMPWHGLSYLLSYTYGKATNNTPGFFPGNPSRGQTVTDPSCVARGTQDCNLDLDKGPADYDARNRLTFAGTYELPWAKENMLLGGWAVNTVITMQSGTPFTVYSDFSGITRANQNGDPNNGPKTTDKWFNTAVFTKATGSQGTAGRNSVRGPGTRTVDLSLFKTFSLAKAGALELRFEGFNIFNTNQYTQPNNVVTDPNFGKITGTRLNTERQVQVAARYIF